MPAENDNQKVSSPGAINMAAPDENAPDAAIASAKGGGNIHLRQMMDENFIEYASYVIKERAIPDVDDGLKPVQRRILWSLFRMDDGKFHKVANTIGHTMQYHPHGDASIGEALVVLANKEYYIEKQGNFGNILTGDPASAARYIECRLSPMAREVLFNNDITAFTDSYDGRNREPMVLPAKVPSLLMLGAHGIAVGMSTNIMPHNFNELLQAQISILRDGDFELYPDFPQGGIMNISEYDGGNGKVTLRAKIDIDGRKLIIREIPATTTTESVIASMEKAVERGKIKIASINDFTTEGVEIEVTPMRGYDPQKALKALYAYTDCSVSVSCSLTVIKENKPVVMTVDEVLRRNTEKLLEYLRRELEIELADLWDKFHDKTLAQIFIENRIYKRIEECESQDAVMTAVRAGLEPFKNKLKREITDEDIEKLLAIAIRRISLFDINKNKKDLDDILKRIDQVEKHLKRLKSYAIKYIEKLLSEYGGLFPRRTVIDDFDLVDRRAAALNNIKVGWDRKNCYIGTSVKADEPVTCNEYDRLLCVERKGSYKVINIPDKIFAGRLYDFRKYDAETEFAVIYRDKKNGKWYYKRCFIDKYITDREYNICPKNCMLEKFTSQLNSTYRCHFKTKRRNQPSHLDINLWQAPARSAKARGLLIDPKPIEKISHVKTMSDDEMAGIVQATESIGIQTEKPESVILTPEPENTAPDNTMAEKPAATPESTTTENTATPAPKTGKPTKPTTKQTAKARKQRNSDSTPEDGETGGETSETTPKPEKKSPGEKAKADGTAKPVKSKNSHPELDIPDLPPADASGPGAKSKSARSKGRENTPANTEKAPADDDKDWGISQPEFGF